MRNNISVVIPAKNEQHSISKLIYSIQQLSIEILEIIVVNDASTDDTSIEAQKAGAKVISHPYSKGNGAAIKTGAREARGDTIIFMDGDGQHNPADIKKLLDTLEVGYDMVVGARSGLESQASVARWSAPTACWAVPGANPA